MWILYSWYGHEYAQVCYITAEFTARKNPCRDYCLMWSISLNSLMQSKKDVTVADVENSFDGNICRCTGILHERSSYRFG
jgi:aerobic-type carbon monoxide dehydrogenase small subunit (CoxS/CutS family)